MPRNKRQGGVCSFFAVVIGFGFFSILWDLAAKTWGLGHGTVLAIFLVAAIVVAAIAEVAVEWVRWEVIPWLYGMARSARRGRDR
ncbi:hypothetical protein ABZ312_11320 [Streptomyces sp. NPDC006207]